jgi:shikimate dehydrogenase
MTQHPARYAVIGHPVSHSRSPAIHQAFADQFGILLSYERIEAALDEFESVVSGFFESGGRGLNVTVPFKERAWVLSEKHLSERANLAGAVNTLWLAQGEIHGCNTDGVGLVRDLKRLQLMGPGDRVLLLGAGGAARGVIGPLLDAGCARLHIVNRTVERATELVGTWSSTNPESRDRLSAGGYDTLAQDCSWDLVINATATSLQGQALALPEPLFGPEVAVYDMMYAAQPTDFLVLAQKAGVTRLADGLGMLVAQAAESFLIWHGVAPDIEPIVQTIRQQMTTTVR